MNVDANGMNSPAYPRLIRRVRALLIDSVVIPVAAMAALVIGDSFGVSGMTAKLALIAIPVFLLEPAMVSLTGGTVGHHLMGIKIAKQDGAGHINIAAATVRFLVKLLFGWFSFVLVFTTKRHQAVHDLAARSIVTFKNADGLPQYDVLPERRIEEAGYIYPVAWKRIMAIFLYGAATVIANAILGSLALSGACLRYDECTALDKLVTWMANIAFLVMFGGVIVLGWKGKLYGCRRKAIAAPAATPSRKPT